MLALLLAWPLLLAALGWCWPWPRRRVWLVPLGGAVQLALVLLSLADPPADALGGWLALDPLGRPVLLLVAVLYMASALYLPGYRGSPHERAERQFHAAMPLFLATMTLVSLAQHLGLLWVAVEASTLASAPLIYYRRQARSLEATWKYLLICSVGIALALLGSFFLGYAGHVGGAVGTLLFADLVREAHRLARPWLHGAFVLMLVGYGTKMGLAPMHTWLPDAHSEAPSPVSALLSGALLNTAFLAILRIYRVCHAAGEAPYARRLLLVLGLFSMVVAAVFLVRSRDLKRMLAWSSVEHMGILALGVGLGGVGVYASFLHMVANGLAKGAVFLAVGDLVRVYHTREVDRVGGVLHRIPWSGAVLVAGFLASAGTPPFASFLSEFLVLRSALDAGRWAVGAGYLVLLWVAFAGMAHSVLAVAQGEPTCGPPAPEDRVSPLTVVPALVLIALVLALGLTIPAPLQALLAGAAAFLEGGA